MNKKNRIFIILISQFNKSNTTLYWPAVIFTVKGTALNIQSRSLYSRQINSDITPTTHYFLCRFNNLVCFTTCSCPVCPDGSERLLPAGVLLNVEGDELLRDTEGQRTLRHLLPNQHPFTVHRLKPVHLTHRVLKHWWRDREKDTETLSETYCTISDHLGKVLWITAACSFHKAIVWLSKTWKYSTQVIRTILWCFLLSDRCLYYILAFKKCLLLSTALFKLL